MDAVEIEMKQTLGGYFPRTFVLNGDTFQVDAHEASQVDAGRRLITHRVQCDRQVFVLEHNTVANTWRCLAVADSDHSVSPIVAREMRTLPVC